ncbi:amino acid carrier protein, partial [Thermosyntropha lipolytica DSM 11003]
MDVQAELLVLVGKLNSILWGPIMLVILLGTGIYYTIRTNFIQIRFLKQAFRQVFGNAFKDRDSKKEGLSSFQSLTTAIAAQVGTGNIVGVATAIAAGGPGAIFWMWVSAFFGMSTIFSEAVLAQKFKTTRDGAVVGGPAYYISQGLGQKWLAVIFAICIVLALGFMGNMVQANSIAVSINNAFGINQLYAGIAVALLVGAVIIGGVKQIGKVTEILVPFMAIIYILGGLIVIILNIEVLLPAFKMIFVGAFSPQSVGGGVLGATIKEAFRYGIARGIFSNEAGLGSTPHAHAIA